MHAGKFGDRVNAPIPVAAPSKAWGCSSTYAGIAGSNPAGGMDVSCGCCVLSGRGLCVALITRSDESYLILVSECYCGASVMKSWPTRAVGLWKNTV